MARKKGWRKGWKEVTLQQARELGQLRATLAVARRELQSRMLSLRRKGSGQEGEAELRETLGDIIQLAQVQMKVMPLEQDLLRVAEQAQSSQQSADAPLSEADWKLLQDALARRARKVLRSAGADRPGIDGGQQVE